MDLFRAVIRSGEKTQRVLQLTEDLLEVNAANYTIWFS
jgi:protein farnesyltransferase/geranylgeranyltransferase type-1 subunit alpha